MKNALVHHANGPQPWRVKAVQLITAYFSGETGAVNRLIEANQHAQTACKLARRQFHSLAQVGVGIASHGVWDALRACNYDGDARSIHNAVQVEGSVFQRVRPVRYDNTVETTRVNQFFTLGGQAQPFRRSDRIAWFLEYGFDMDV